MAKSNPRKQITEAKAALKEVMQEHLAIIAGGMIDQIMAKLTRLTQSQRLTAIKDIKASGLNEYKDSLLSAFAVIAYDALEAVRKEVPPKKNVQLMEREESLQLGEFEELPPGIRDKIKKQQELLVTTQQSDLEKAIYYQFNHSVDSTDSLDLIRHDLEMSAQDYVVGSAIDGGASALSSQIVNETRNAFLFDDEVADEIEAYEFVNGDPVSPICQDLAGTVFDKDDPNRFRYTPPLHFNCKSYIRPILKGNLGGSKIVPLKPSTQKIEDSIQFAEHLCCGGHLMVLQNEADKNPVN